MGEQKLGSGQTHRFGDASGSRDAQGSWDAHRLTRRTLLGGVAAAGAASLVGPAAGLAEAIGGRRTLASRWLGALRGESAPLRAPARFVLAGIQWCGPAAAAVELRAQAPDGRWSPWVIASALGHDGDGVPASEVRFGEPVWTGSAVGVQLRTNRTVQDVELHFVTAEASIGTAVAAAALPLAQPVLNAGPGQPRILARRGWAAGQAHPVHTPEYGAIKLAFVHHTVNPNGYSAAAVPAMLRAIFDYHVQVRGFWDIAYNFLIDAYGRIWEGRAGGIDMPVMGAHAGGYNLESTGVAILGDFMNVVPSSAAVGALEQLLAWKLSLHGVPARGRVTVVVDPSDAFYTPFAPGAHVSLPRVAGHRDGDLTDCPGNALYGELPSIRPHVFSLQGTPARLTLAAPSAPVLAGSTVPLAGRLVLLSGVPLAGAPLELQQLAPTVPPASTVATTTTASDGSWTNSALNFEHNALVRALHRPYPASVADWALVAVAPVLTVSVQSTSPLVLTGTVSPAKHPVILDLYPAGRTAGKPVRRKRVRAAGGAFTARMAPPPGSYVVVARTAADAVNAAGVSVPVAVAVT